jgi:hypothetical protein
MEEDIFRSLSPQSSLTKKMEKIEARLKEATDLAGERAKYDSAHDEEVLNALTVVADFIRRKKRVCYGGTAMNAILPDKDKFYDPEVDLPDYDFYTPEVEEDVAELVEDLKAAGFKDVYQRVGIHEGTKKILVNFVAVADVSRIEKELYTVFHERAVVKDGIHYTDPDILRMMMYLEISRPKGQVARWDKVFERLQLINRAFPPRSGKSGSASRRSRRPRGSSRCASRPEGKSIPAAAQEALVKYIVENQRVLCNGPVLGLYARGIRRGDAVFRADEPAGPMLFTSPDPKEDAMRLKGLLKTVGKVEVYVHKPRGEIVPQRFELRVDGQIVCLMIEEVACHSYNNFPLEDGRVIQVGSLEFLVTLYLSLHIFTKHSREILGPDAMCLVARCIDLAMENYLSDRSQFPAFSLSCRGHQTGYASLIRQKVLRIKREKAKADRAGAKTKAGTKKKKKAAKKPKTKKKVQ